MDPGGQSGRQRFLHPEGMVDAAAPGGGQVSHLLGPCKPSSSTRSSSTPPRTSRPRNACSAPGSSTRPTKCRSTRRRVPPGAAAVLRIDPLLGIYFYRINTTSPPLNDKRVRKALALAINREQLVERRSPGRASIPPTTRVLRWRRSPLPPACRATWTKARRLLAEAGYPGGKGLRKIDLLYNTSQNHKKIAEADPADVAGQSWGRSRPRMNQEWKVYLDSQDTLNYDLPGRLDCGLCRSQHLLRSVADRRWQQRHRASPTRI
jgi:hypothetical protein